MCRVQVAILVKEFPPDVIGGTETQTFRMAKKLGSCSNHDVTVYTKSYGRNQLDQVPFELVRVPNWRITPFLSTLTFVLVSFVYLLRDRHRYDILQCMMIYPNGFVGYLINAVFGLPYLAWIRGGDYYFMKENPIKRWMISRVLFDTTVLVQSEQIGRDVHKEFPYADLEVLGNGIDIPAETASGDEIVYVGRLEEQKGVDVLLNALENIDETVRIVGDGPERKKLQSLASTLEIDVNFVGWVPPENVTEHLKKGKVFVLPSVRGEGLPNAVLEAMAIGLPVVATDTGGVTDLIEDGVNGYLVQPGDEVALQQAISQVIWDDDTRKLGQNARKFVQENYSWPIIVESLISHYHSLVD